jgi:hypothetical protein
VAACTNDEAPEPSVTTQGATRHRSNGPQPGDARRPRYTPARGRVTVRASRSAASRGLKEYVRVVHSPPASKNRVLADVVHDSHPMYDSICVQIHTSSTSEPYVIRPPVLEVVLGDGPVASVN